MAYPSSQLTIPNPLPTDYLGGQVGANSKRLDISLLTETILVTITAVSAVALFNYGTHISKSAWLIVPGILMTAAFIPTAIKKRRFAEIGSSISQIKHSLAVLGWTCIAVFPVTFFALWLLKHYGLELPPKPVLPQNHQWFCWLIYQFMYVAVAEEVFFRGYLQSNILRLAGTVIAGQYRLQQWTSIVLSAAFFALAHIAVQGHIISVLTFLPGLILGWLFIRTKLLLAPILFHGLANIYYFIAISALT